MPEDEPVTPDPNNPVEDPDVPPAGPDPSLDPEPLTDQEKRIKDLKAESIKHRREAKEAKAAATATAEELEKIKKLIGGEEDGPDVEKKLAGMESRVTAANTRLLRAEIREISANLGFSRPRDVYAIMMDRGCLSDLALDEDGEDFPGLQEAIEAFAEENADLIGKTSGDASGGSQKVGSLTQKKPDEGKSLEGYLAKLTDSQKQAARISINARTYGEGYAFRMVAWQMALSDGVELPKPQAKAA